MEEDGLEKLWDQDTPIRLPFWLILLLKFSPRLAFRYFARQRGIRNNAQEKMHEAFAQSERIDMFPLQSSRGFMLVIDNRLSLWFYQNGDGFKYDGIEIGEYEKGDVTILDKLLK